VGTKAIVRRLLSAEIAGGKVKLHFGAVQSEGVEFSDIWIVGTGEGTGSRGGIDAGHWQFVKGPWTRNLATASKAAEDSIRAESAK
jgi:hypothetical protein